MILFTDVSTFTDLIANEKMNAPVVLSLTCMMEGIEQLNILPRDNPNMFSKSIDDRINDSFIANYIIGNDSVFMEFFSKVMYPAYAGLDVIILISLGGIYDQITEFLMKFIQQRYGYNCAIINYASDFDYIDKNMSFSIQGIYQFDQDKLRYTGLGANVFGIPNVNNIDDSKKSDYADSLMRY